MRMISASSDEPPRDPTHKGGVAVKERIETKKPKMYKVLIHNDNYSTMEFVVWILTGIFRRNEAEATRIMLHIHKNGMGVAGVYSKEIAESKCRKATELARMNEFPLQCTYEEA